MNTNFGFVPSEITENTKRYAAPASMNLPEEYSYKNYLPEAFNQGSNPFCVPYSISSFLNWRVNLPSGEKKDNKVVYREIFTNGGGSSDGMTFVNAFAYLKNHGVKSDAGNLKVTSYGLVNSVTALKCAIIANGPCVGALPVYDANGYYNDFWNKMYGPLVGYHAISIVGYDKDGFIIRNSWGTSWGNNGYTHIDWKDINKFIEIWTIME